MKRNTDSTADNHTGRQTARFKFKEDKEETIVKTKQTYSMEYKGYDIFVFKSEDRTELSICPTGASSIRMGIVHCYPRFVSDVETFATDSQEVFSVIASALRSAGLDDLRGKYEKMSDDMQEMTRKRLEAKMKDAKRIDT